MPVLPELELLLERIRTAEGSLDPMPLAERRATVHRGIDAQLEHMVAPVPLVTYSDHSVAVDGGEITVRLYRPEPNSTPGCHLYIHGGGWWMGTLEQSDLACSRIARGVGCLVASIDHRLAPEHPYPIPLEDCYAALLWLDASAQELGLDSARISLGGVSSGANLAAATALCARDRGGPVTIAQTLEVPILDLTMSNPSIEEFGDGYMLTRERLASEIGDYCEPTHRTEPHASPLLANDLSGLPPALIAVAEYDLLRDDGESYSARLKAAAVPAVAIRMQGHLHGSLGLTRLVPSALEWHERMHAFLRDHHRAYTATMGAR
jgi:acetyl esterase